MGVPDRWYDYTKVGKEIANSRIIAFKTPLENSALKNSRERFCIDDLVTKIPQLGLVIDFTATNKYYRGQLLEERGIKYQKLKLEGRVVPRPNNYNQFEAIVDEFVANPENNGFLVGVHCTHGVNRTGYMISKYLIRRLNFSPKVAVQKFESARGHRIERNNYVTDLMALGGSSWSDNSNNYRDGGDGDLDNYERRSTTGSRWSRPREERRDRNRFWSNRSSAPDNDAYLSWRK